MCTRKDRTKRDGEFAENVVNCSPSIVQLPHRVVDVQISETYERGSKPTLGLSQMSLPLISYALHGPCSRQLIE